MIRLLRLEFVRLMAQRRWWLPLPIFAILTYLSVENVWVDHLNYDVQVNMWDAFLMTFNDPFYFRLAFLLLFVFLVGDIFIRDMHSQYHVLILSRQSRLMWWLTKIVTVLLAAFVYIGMGVTVSVLTAALPLPVEWRFSEHALGTNPDVVKFYANVPVGVHPLEYVIRLGAYSALGMWVFALLPITVSLFVRKAIVPITVAAVTVFSSLIFMKGYLKAKWDLTYHMMYDLHFPTLGFPYFSFAFSFVYFAVFAVVWLVGGWLAVRRADL